MASSVELRGFHHAVSPGRPIPHCRTGIRHGADGGPGPPRLRRGVVRRAPLRRLRADRLPRGVHRRGRRADQAHPSRHRRRVAAVPPSADGGRQVGAARPPDSGSGDVRHRAGCVAVRRVHDGHRSRRAAPDDAGVARRDPRAVPGCARRADQQALRLVHAARRPASHPAVHLAVPRNIYGSNDFPVRTAARRRAGHVAAFVVDVGAGRLRSA